MTTWLLIIYLHGGLRVVATPDLFACLARAQFEARYDVGAYPRCEKWTGSEA